MICGEGVGLRLVLEEDLPLIAKWRDDDATRAMFYSFALMSEAGLRNSFKGLVGNPARMRFMVQRLEDGVTIGMVGLEHIEYRNQAAELAGLVIDPAERGRGWGTKAVGTLIRYAFDDLNLNRLYARLYGSNRAGQRVAEKAGLQSEGVARDGVYHDWAYQDVIYMAILREEWKHERATNTAFR
jgi:diamine N-acetyltransferase